MIISKEVHITSMRNMTDEVNEHVNIKLVKYEGIHENLGWNEYDNY